MEALTDSEGVARVEAVRAAARVHEAAERKRQLDALVAEDKELVIKGLNGFTTIYLIVLIVYIIIFTWSIYLHVSCNNGISIGIIPAIFMPVFYIPYALAIC